MTGKDLITIYFPLQFPLQDMTINEQQHEVYGMEISSAAAAAADRRAGQQQ
jgi:hypothetical protein